MKHKTAELEGALLAAAVAQAEGLTFRLVSGGWNYCLVEGHSRTHGVYSPYTEWAQGGPIIERERIDLVCTDSDDGWAAAGNRAPFANAAGSTPLIAAMRAYVASKFGDEVEL